MSHIVRTALLFLFLFSFSPGSLTGQHNSETHRDALIGFACRKNAISTTEKRKADSLAANLDLPVSYIEKNNRVVTLQRLGRNSRPVYYATDNITAAAIISADKLWSDNNDSPSLSGEGTEINLWDGGAVLTSHREFQDEAGSRVTLRDIESTLSGHSTHIAGTMIAAGVDLNARGMAGKAAVKSWDYNDDLSEMASAAADGIILSNHSYGPLCGWYYNTSNDSWYWYGEPDISETEDYKFGFYDQESADLDFIAFNAPYYLIVKSAGNDRNDYPSTSFIHYVWDETWKLVNDERDPDGGTDGYDCLSPMAVAKNILTVGALDDEGEITDFSSFGPTDDGRIKPDVVANGYTVYSSVSTGTDSYDSYNGTSMAAASVTGSVALLQQLQNILNPGIPLASATIKALLIHSATEAGASPGPDYSFGWGLLNIKEAADLVSQNSANGGKNIYEGFISDGETICFPVETDLSPYLKVTICWTDPPGQPSSVSLNPREGRLVNDLDLAVENSVSHQFYLPWVLDVENPSAAATNGINHSDNVEQIVIANPGENSFNIVVSHSGTITGMSQSFSLIITGITTPSRLFPPQKLTYKISLPCVLLKWNAPDSGNPVTYKVYRNDQILAETTDTSFSDESIIPNNIYEYSVTAVYEFDNDYAESVGTNIITVLPQYLRPLPFSVDFEVEYVDVTVKNQETGWLWGDNESLNSYYLDFSSDTTNFIAADSYSAGKAIHVWDIAATAPLSLGEYENIDLSFDYLLKNGIYDAIDELHIVYKLQEDTEWHDLLSLESSFKWKHESVELPDEICKNGTQIGFYYDDMYQWGMGAGLDNIMITGTQVRSVDLSLDSMTSPFSSCALMAEENVVVTVRNNSTQPALPGDIINIQMSLSSGESITDVIILNDELGCGDILTWQMSAAADLSEPGDYIFNFTVSSVLDINDLNNHLSAVVSVYGNPVALILNSDTSACINEPPVPVMVSPSGGALSGPGISGLFFNPSTAGEGYHTITYSYTDDNGCAAATSTVFVVNNLPQPEILNQDLFFCTADQATEIIVNPEGGILSGPGVVDGFFHPDITGAGAFYITYDYTNAFGCAAVTPALVTVYENPVIDVGPDTTIASDETIRFELPSNDLTFLWFDGSTDNFLSIAAEDYGAGIYNVWVTVTNIYSCSTTDSARLTIYLADYIKPQYSATELLVYPNPVKNGIYIKTDNQETISDFLLYGYDGKLIMKSIPCTFPYFDLTGLRSGYYIMKISIGRKTYYIRIIKI